MKRLVVLVFISFFLSSAVSQCTLFDCAGKKPHENTIFDVLAPQGDITITSTDGSFLTLRFEKNGNFTIVNTDYFALVPFVGLHVINSSGNNDKSWISIATSKKITLPSTFHIAMWQNFVIDYTEKYFDLYMQYSGGGQYGASFSVLGKFTNGSVVSYISTGIVIKVVNRQVQLNCHSVSHGSNRPSVTDVERQYFY